MHKEFSGGLQAIDGICCVRNNLRLFRLTSRLPGGLGCNLLGLHWLQPCLQIAATSLSCILPTDLGHLAPLGVLGILDLKEITKISRLALAFPSLARSLSERWGTNCLAFSA